MRGAGSAWRIPGYVAEELLGSGSAGEVWRGRSTRTGDAVALKRLATPDAVDRSAAETEAGLLAALEHPNVVRLRELVTTATAVVLVLDLAEGGSLAALLRRRGRLAAGETVSALAPIGAALAHIHSTGVVHGDVAPGNILFCSRGRPMLGDLGVARLLGQHGPARTTLPYLDPAVANGSAPGSPSDVFMLAAVALHCLTGAPPWTASSLEQIVALAATGEIDGLEERLGQMPKEVAAVLHRALDPAPHARGTAAEFALDLRYAATPLAVELSAGRVLPGSGSMPRVSNRVSADAAGLASSRDRAAGREEASSARAPAVSTPALRGDHRTTEPDARRGSRRTPHIPRHGVAAPAGVAAGGGRRASSRTGRWSGNGRGGAEVPDRLAAIVASAGRPTFAVAGSPPSAGDRIPLTDVIRRPPPRLEDGDGSRRAWWKSRVPPGDRGAGRRSGHLRRAWVAAAVVCIAVVGAAAGWWRSSQGAAAAPDAPPVFVAASSGSPTGPASGPSRSSSSDPTSSGATASRATASAATASGATAGKGAPPASDRAWASVLAALDASRERAFATADAEELAGIWSAGPLLREDGATLIRLTSPGSGCGLVGLTTHYGDVRTVGLDADTVTLRASVTVTAARLVCAGQLRARTRPTGALAVRLQLARTSHGWRIAALEPT